MSNIKAKQPTAKDLRIERLEQQVYEQRKEIGQLRSQLDEQNDKKCASLRFELTQEQRHNANIMDLAMAAITQKNPRLETQLKEIECGMKRNY